MPNKQLEKPITTEYELARCIAKRHSEHMDDVILSFKDRLADIIENERKHNHDEHWVYKNNAGLHFDVVRFVMITEHLFYMFDYKGLLRYPKKIIPCPGNLKEALQDLQKLDERVKKFLDEGQDSDNKPLKRPIATKEELGMYITHHIGECTNKLIERYKAEKAKSWESRLRCGGGWWDFKGWIKDLEYLLSMLKLEGLIDPYHKSMSGPVEHCIWRLQRIIEEEKLNDKQTT